MSSVMREEDYSTLGTARLTERSSPNSTNSQKPADELYASFRQSFPEVGPGTTSSAAPTRSTTSLSDALIDADMIHRYESDSSVLPIDALAHIGHDHDDSKDHETTPRGSHEPWRFTPSLMDPNSFAFASFANQPPGYYTPTPGGSNTSYCNQAGDLHTPGMGIGMGTPLSLPTSAGGLDASHTMDMHSFDPHNFHNINPFAPQQSFAPSQFTHQDSGFDQQMDILGNGSPMDDMGIDTEMHGHPPEMTFSMKPYEGAMAAPPIQSIEKFRYHVTLNAPTAMIKHADEIPVTYLNKGQAYSMSIVDTAPPTPISASVRYRTFVRISFEDEQQRAKPSACWQLWKEGRGTNEAHQRGGKLQAVEYVDPNQGGDDDSRRTRTELDTASFDGFSVIWSPSASGSADCSVAVRFNFLSTDFSHSKGVKGIPVRLCAKTEVLSSDSLSPRSTASNTAEVCFCKVKLFRDHGAERKLSNDVAHVKKTIDKLKQQIAQSETGMKDFGKRKRSASIATKASSSGRPGKVAKHKRTWSMSSTSSSGGRPPAEEDLHLKLATSQDMFTSTRPVSVLYLRGLEQDDPDLFPVRLTGEPVDLTKVEPQDVATWERRQSVGTTNTAGTSCLVSPSPSSNSLQSQGRHQSLAFQHPVPFNPPQDDWSQYQQMAPADLQSSNPQNLASPPEAAVKIPKTQQNGSGMLSGWIEALGVDSSYRPPSERPVKPVACFYILPKLASRSLDTEYYRAVYLLQRTCSDLVQNIASKSNINPAQIIRTLHVNSKGLHIMVDDDVVREIPEGQDIKVEITEIKPYTPIKREWDSGPTDAQVDNDLGVSQHASTRGFELKLFF
ncbi:MAG: hypothetical protein M1827_001643 [Pycnora praestabilis]|nr:MAG: hypothetical protein M1827_001643 [Pycnora praestabilis]